MKITKGGLATLATIGLVSVGGLGVAYAANDNSSSSYPPIVDKLAEKFNLNKDEVKQVFEQQRAEHQAEHKQRLEERLNQAVKDGKLTEEQKTKLVTKLEEMHAKREEMKDKTHEEREAYREEFENWAEDNNINLQEVMPLGEGRGHGPRGHRL